MVKREVLKEDCLRGIMTFLQTTEDRGERRILKVSIGISNSNAVRRRKPCTIRKARDGCRNVLFRNVERKL